MCIIALGYSLAARILWRIEKSGSIISDGQLTTVEQLQDHVTDMAPFDLRELKVNVHDFLDYWPHNGQKHGVDSISHIFGVVCSRVMFSSFVLCGWKMNGQCK